MKVTKNISSISTSNAFLALALEGGYEVLSLEVRNNGHFNLKLDKVGVMELIEVLQEQLNRMEEKPTEEEIQALAIAYESLRRTAWADPVLVKAMSKTLQENDYRPWTTFHTPPRIGQKVQARMGVQLGTEVGYYLFDPGTNMPFKVGPKHYRGCDRWRPVAE